VNLTMLLVLVFVLGRNLIKLFIERRRSVRGAKFKTKLVIVFIGFALLPSALIMLVGSNLISTAVERWFSHPVEAVLVGAQDVVEHYYHEKQESATFYARRLSREIGEGELLSPKHLSMLGRSMEARLTLYRLDMITVLSATQALWTSARPGLPQYNPDSTIRLRRPVSAGGDASPGLPRRRHARPVRVADLQKRAAKSKRGGRSYFILQDHRRTSRT
jgi:two-component system nitrogen regulation sensor histidine kinase NtrY